MKKDIQLGKQVLRSEARAIQSLISHVNRDFEKAVDLIKRCEDRVIITGMGKPGIIGRKIAATLASTGTPSLFLHPAEAVHGDLGMVTKEDVIVAISNSGETEEVTRLLSVIKKIGARLIAMTGNLKSTLARHADVVLNVQIDREACPWNLAPTASTTAALAMGDALAVCAAKRRGFKESDFALFHPGGSLGKKLLRVKDIMRKGKSHPVVKPETTIQKALFAITAARAGSCSIADEKGRLLAIFTDGDLRRHIDERGLKILQEPVLKYATRKPTVIQEDHLAAEALQRLRDKKIDELPVVNRSGKAVGLLDVQDLLKAGFL
ncbi:MAG: KpsF/GutQ family sugar-phosphate isomerase [Candidatus Omnitrophica bacterium CG11_big_fil_rev_8_21_14_0_20_45_26]|uniref:KpsF/GutQ family sugar-phosphate isomerase n=1 Tax=Candidatus Abzuiibacterium crystallinum TaxID=1974748 RepID=A0A2H0LMM7_9BACT|nr:MAG: KpsF/GutQ family sugar-phosphate isomerase [Candidatus Omnitrophica bacterium CG11_big_fil_rev_8_21_14_0_20_45_26]PIW65206.1 MAG: KpsF/GutQ family sugar-phosphate isomerase [Candidatus Omnitrophica bacterium CG12_big_fil_rev_8_21_14_0_65_45_16]